jgi:hypothetical protein
MVIVFRFKEGVLGSRAYRGIRLHFDRQGSDSAASGLMYDTENDPRHLQPGEYGVVLHREDPETKRQALHYLQARSDIDATSIYEWDAEAV